MASAQVVGNAKAYYEKNKACVDELMNSAKNPSIELKGAVTSGYIKNNTHSHQFLLEASHDYAGKPVIPYPGCMGKSAHFLHANQVLCATDMAAVVYTEGNSINGWLLAWSVSGGRDSHNKVYVEYGLLPHVTNWDNVKAKLCASDSECYFVDPCHPEISMFAKITPTGEKAKLVAIYEKC